MWKSTRPRIWQVSTIFVLLSSSVSVVAQSVNSKHFAVDSRVTLETERTPPIKSTTLFVDHLAYDIVHGSPPQIARFDFARQVVDLISRPRQVSTRVQFVDVLRFESELSTRAGERGGLAAFLANPDYNRDIDAASKTLKLTSPWFSYEVQAAESAGFVVDRMTAFADWSARLHCMLSPVAPPAAARIELNAQLKKQNWRAERVTRRAGIRAGNLGIVSSQHQLRQSLQDADWELIRGVEKDLEDFSRVSFFEFRGVQISRRETTKK